MSSPPPPSSPHGLDLVIDFVNTLDIEAGREELDTPAALRRWLVGHDLLEASARVSPDAHAEALRLREALRAAMVANADRVEDQAAFAELERIAREGALAVHFDGGASVALRAGAAGVAGALARLLVPVAAALGDGSWQRVKACRSADCRWAFYDRSRNRSGAWCEMAVCGNRTKVRAYRRRAGAHG